MMLGTRTNLRRTTTVILEKIAPEPVREVLRTTKAFLKAASVLLMVYAAWIFAPIYSKKLEFEQSVEQIARVSAYNDHEEGEIHNEVMEQARGLGVNLKEENLQVTRDKAYVRITATYDVPVNLPGGKVLTLSFSPSSVEKSLNHPAIQAKTLKDGK